MPKARRGEAIEPDCPVPQTHKRLDDAHRLWHEALNAYARPNEFRRKLHAAIQELRNVTFVLQNEKSNIPGFAEWYRTHQDRLRSNSIAKWASDARTQITKRGDLKTHSTATASIIHGYLRSPTATFQVDPLEPTERIAHSAAAHFAREIKDPEAILVVTRCWVADSLPEHEVLEAVAAVYGMIEEIVAEAHQMTGRSFRMRRCTFNRGRLRSTGSSCMSIDVDKRTVRLRIRSRQKIRMIRKSVKVSGKSELIRRYGKIPQLPPLASTDDLIHHGREMHLIARRLLRSDGFHVSFMHIFRNNKLIDMHGVEYEGPPEKHAYWHDVADQISRTGADALIFTTEVWMAPLDPAQPIRRASDSPDRREALTTVVALMDGREFLFSTEFHRSQGAVELSKMKEDADSRANHLFPVRLAWERLKAR